MTTRAERYALRTEVDGHMVSTTPVKHGRIGTYHNPLNQPRFGAATAASLGVFRPPGATTSSDSGGWAEQTQGLFDALKGSTTFWVIVGIVGFIALVALFRGGR